MTLRVQSKALRLTPQANGRHTVAVIYRGRRKRLAMVRQRDVDIKSPEGRDTIERIVKEQIHDRLRKATEVNA